MFSHQMTLVAAAGGAHRRQGKFPYPGARFSEVPVTFRGPERCICVWRVCIQDQSFNNFENDTIKLSVNKAELTGL